MLHLKARLGTFSAPRAQSSTPAPSTWANTHGISAPCPGTHLGQPWLASAPPCAHLCPPVPIAAQPPVARTCTNSASQIAGRAVQPNLQHSQDASHLSAGSRASRGRARAHHLCQTAISTLSAAQKRGSRSGGQPGASSSPLLASASSAGSPGRYPSPQMRLAVDIPDQRLVQMSHS